MLIAVTGVGLGSLGLRDAQGVAGFKKFQRQFGIQNDRIELVTGGDVAAAFQKFILGVHRLDGPLGILADHVFEHHHVAGLPHRIIRFGGDDQSEGLKIGGDIHLAAMVIAHQNFAQVHRPALGRDRPQDVGQILVAESRGLFQVAEFHFDFDVALLALHFGFTAGLGHQIGAGEIHLGGSAAMLVVDRLNAAADYRDPEGRGVLHGFDTVVENCFERMHSN